MQPGDVLRYLEADLSRREARFRARVALLVFLSTVALPLWQYSLTKQPGVDLEDWLLASGVAAITYLAVGGTIIRRVARLVQPPALPSEASPHATAIGLRMLGTYGIGPSAKAALLLEAGARLGLMAICLWAWHTSGISPWLAFPVIAVLGAGATISLAVAVLTMSSMRTLWRYIRFTLSLEKPSTPRSASEATAKDVEENIKEVLEQAQRILPGRVWKVFLAVMRHGMATIHLVLLVAAGTITIMAFGTVSSTAAVVEQAGRILPALAAVLIILWILREAISVLVSYDRALVQQLIMVSLLEQRDTNQVLELFGLIALAQEEDVRLPDRLSTIIDDLKLDSHPVGS